MWWWSLFEGDFGHCWGDIITSIDLWGLYRSSTPTRVCWRLARKPVDVWILFLEFFGITWQDFCQSRGSYAQWLHHYAAWSSQYLDWNYILQPAVMMQTCLSILSKHGIEEQHCTQHFPGVLNFVKHPELYLKTFKLQNVYIAMWVASSLPQVTAMRFLSLTCSYMF